MTDPAAIQVFDTFTATEDSIFSFDTTDWVDPPIFVTELPETSEESNIRILGEKEYRDSVTPTLWHRYLTLGRYATDGFTFDSLMENIDTEPKAALCAIWYQTNYYLDRQMDIPFKLQQWSQHRAQPYLAKHAFATFQVDTLRTSWKDYSRLNSLPNPWSEVPGTKQKQKPKQRPKVTNPYKKASRPHGTVNTPTTIPEEESATSNATSATPPTLSGQKRTKDDVSATSSTDGKMSALLPDSNVPVCDGTKRVIFRWKVPINLSRISSQSTEIQKEIHALINEFFTDDDGFIYDWNDEGVDKHNVVSKLSPLELRNYLPSSINISADSKITVQIRFGFFGNTPANWRNSTTTKEKLAKYDVTVAISNSTSTSGKLMIAGYILLKAPMTTHRLRYLQYLRKSLPENTPPFDILLHNRSPASNEVTPHLAVQCGKKHVHVLSEVLCPFLTGDNSALYMPRSLISDMPDDKVIEFFKHHDAYCKNLRSHPLSPLLRNIDKPRKEYNPNGSLSVERTAREWARSLKPNNTDPGHFDVVNGGKDQLAYLIFPSHLADIAAQHVTTYRTRLYPRRKREDQFKADAGPPTTVHLSKRVIANLEFMERLCSTQQKNADSTAGASKPKETDDHSTDSVSITSSVTQASRPLTPQESLRQQLDKRIASLDDKPSTASDTHKNSASTVNSDESTIATTVSDKSKGSGRMSTSSAKIRQLDEILQRYKQDSAQSQAQQSERVSQMERQLQRVQEFDSKLDTIQTDFATRINLLEGRMEESMNNNMAKLMALVQSMNSVQHPSTPTKQTPTNSSSTSPQAADLAALHQLNNLDSDGSSTLASSSSKASGMSIESTDPMQSPDHKKHKSASRKGPSKKKVLKESIRRRLDELNESRTYETGETGSHSSSDTLDKITDEMNEIMESETAISNLIPPTSERQYTANTRQEVDTQAPSSDGRGSSS